MIELIIIILDHIYDLVLVSVIEVGSSSLSDERRTAPIGCPSPSQPS